MLAFDVMTSPRTVQVADAVTVDVHDHGDGEPLLLIQTALLTEALVPLSHESEIARNFRVIDCRRREYGPSGTVSEPGSVRRDALDCLAVLDALSARPAHILGTSYSAAVALELAAIDPSAVRTLTLIEPPPRHGPPTEEFLAANRRLHDAYTAEGVTQALEQFNRALGIPSWLEERSTANEQHIAQVERDATTFFASDVPALLGWVFEPARTAAITCPVLYIGGAESHPWFAHVHRWVTEIFPHCEDHLVDGAGHTVASTHSHVVAELVANFAAKHH